MAKQAGLAEKELILTGYVPDQDLIALYNLATLFVFPSKHEGFRFTSTRSNDVWNAYNRI